MDILSFLVPLWLCVDRLGLRLDVLMQLLRLQVCAAAKHKGGGGCCRASALRLLAEPYPFTVAS